MEIRPVERLTLIMLAEIYERLEIDSEAGIKPEFIKQALFNGADWALDWSMDGISHVRAPPDDVVETVTAVLNMYSALKLDWAALPEDGRSTVDEQDVTLGGFDGSSEAEHLAAARFMTNKLGGWPDLKHLVKNSRAPTLDRVAPMLDRWRSIIRTRLPGRDGLTADEIRQIIGR